MFSPAERQPGTPPPVPLAALRQSGIEQKKGPPPIPEAAKKPKAGGPPPIPTNIREASIKQFKQRIEGMEIQKQDVVEAFEAQGFDGLTVVATLEKKNERKGIPDDFNQDNILLDPKNGLFGVLDGLGGEGSGDKASKAASEMIPKNYEEATKLLTGLDSKDIQDRLIAQMVKKIGVDTPGVSIEVTKQVEAILTEVNDPRFGKKALALIESIRQSNGAVRESKGKTTATIGMVHHTPDGRRFAVIANIGDGAAFKRRANGEIIQLTEEDSALNALKNAGILKEDTLQEMKQNPDKPFPPTNKSYKQLKLAMASALGSSSSFEPSLVVRTLRPGEELILGTDGLVDKLEDPDTEELDTGLMNKGLQGATATERMNNLRKTAKDNKRSLKQDDDIAVISVGIK